MENVPIFVGYAGFLGWLGYSVHSDYDIFRSCVELDIYIMPFGVVLLTCAIFIMAMETFERRFSEEYKKLANHFEPRAAFFVNAIIAIGVWVLVFPAVTIWYMIKFSANCRHRTSTWHLICYWLLTIYAAIFWLMMMIGIFVVLREASVENIIAGWRFLTGYQSRRYKQLSQYLKTSIGTEDALRLYVTEFRQIKQSLTNGWFAIRHRDYPFDDTLAEFFVYYSSWSVPSFDEDPALHEFIHMRGCVVCDEASWQTLYQNTGTRLTLFGCGHIGHDYCMKRILKATRHCLRCFSDLDPFERLTPTSRKPSMIHIDQLAELAKSTDVRNYTPEHRQSLKSQV